MPSRSVSTEAGQVHMLIWQEPYYPGEIDLGAFEWRKQESGGFAGYLEDAPVWTWYPRGGQLKHRVHVPDFLRRFRVVLPKQAYEAGEFTDRMLAKAVVK